MYSEKLGSFSTSTTMITGTESSPTALRARWNEAEAIGAAVRMQSRFLIAADPEPLCEPPNINNCESISSSSTIPDHCWSYVDNGASVGRGSLLSRQNRDILHKTDQELNNQLRLATGRGYNTDDIEESFNTSLENLELSLAVKFADVTVDDHLPTDTRTLLPDDVGDHDYEEEEMKEEEAIATAEEVGDCCAIEWEERTSPPEVPPDLLTKKQSKNVALCSLEKIKQKVQYELSASPVIFGTPATSNLSDKMKEDLRSESKAATDQQSAACEPLLGNWPTESSGNNWSMFVPQQVSQVPDFHNVTVHKPAQAQQLDAVGPQTDALLDQSHTPSSSHRKKKKNKKPIQLLDFIAPALRSEQPTIAPPDFRYQTNGILPFTRNSDYNRPLGTGTALHITFGAVTQNQFQSSKTFNKNKGDFNLNDVEFPELH